MTSSGAKILVIDDEPQIQKLLRVTLQAQGFEIVAASSGEEGILKTTIVRPDLIVLDLGLPDIPGMEVLHRIREWTQIPIVVLTAKDREEDKITALDSGADDYVTKPFGMGELLARIRVALRHNAKSQDEPILDFGRLVIDLPGRTVELDGEKIKLTPTEYELLKILATNAGRVMTHKQLLQQVWGGHQYDTDSHYLRVYIGHLRKKIENDSARPNFIITEPGIGYRFMINT
ncbi:response regulator [Bacillus salipaludis]|uniref:Transcriptional regulatory protein KdpE n=1 Tax=Bacillus salipaludis TaxID=2547811 RepID=A0A4R5VJY2_9BACI|nr:response regulator [Bacillus salipaludis]TDK55365.1 response regulator [Bacillus salipaludis]